MNFIRRHNKIDAEQWDGTIESAEHIKKIFRLDSYSIINGDLYISPRISIKSNDYLILEDDEFKTYNEERFNKIFIDNNKYDKVLIHGIEEMIKNIEVMQGTMQRDGKCIFCDNNLDINEQAHKLGYKCYNPCTCYNTDKCLSETNQFIYDYIQNIMEKLSEIK